MCECQANEERERKATPVAANASVAVARMPTMESPSQIRRGTSMESRHVSYRFYAIGYRMLTLCVENSGFDLPMSLMQWKRTLIPSLQRGN